MKKSLFTKTLVFCMGVLFFVVHPGVIMGGAENKPGNPAHEKFLYVASLDKGGKDPDFLAVVGVDPSDPSSFSKIIHRVDMRHVGDEIHHFGYNQNQSKLVVPGVFSGRIYIIDVSDPRRPFIKTVNEDLIKKSGHTVPHTVIALPNGNILLTMIGANTDSTAPGGLVEINGDTGEYIRTFGPPVNRDFNKIHPKYMYDAGIKPELNRMITTSFGLPKHVAPGITVDGLGTDISVWDWKEEKVIQHVNLGAGTGALEVRWRSEQGSTIGYTNTPGSNEIWAWEDLDGDGRYNFKVVIKLPDGSVPTDILLSHDDKFIYVANWMGNNVRQYNIEVPLKPVFVAQIEIPYAQMIRLSPDNRRLYVTNSLLSSWDDTEFPKGVTRNSKYGIFLVDVDHKKGGMSLNRKFYVDMMKVQKQSTIGPARPHMMLFDPSVKSEFGRH